MSKFLLTIFYLYMQTFVYNLFEVNKVEIKSENIAYEYREKLLLKIIKEWGWDYENAYSIVKIPETIDEMESEYERTICICYPDVEKTIYAMELM